MRLLLQDVSSWLGGPGLGRGNYGREHFTHPDIGYRVSQGFVHFCIFHPLFLSLFFWAVLKNHNKKENKFVDVVLDFLFDHPRSCVSVLTSEQKMC